MRTAADARPTRTVTPEPEARPAAAPAPSRPSRPARPSVVLEPSTGLGRSAPAPARSAARPISNPSRELVLARREALSQRGKRADTSRDRSRTEARKAAPAAASSTEAATTAKPCKCQERRAEASATPSLGASLAARSASGPERRSTAKRHAQHNPSRALVLARREALSKRGKSANTPATSRTAAMARQGNPDLTTRELAQKVRELKSRVGSSGAVRGSGTTRPTGPNRHGPARPPRPMPTGRWG